MRLFTPFSEGLKSCVQTERDWEAPRCCLQEVREVCPIGESLQTPLISESTHQEMLKAHLGQQGFLVWFSVELTVLFFVWKWKKKRENRSIVLNKCGSLTLPLDLGSDVHSDVHVIILNVFVFLNCAGQQQHLTWATCCCQPYQLVLRLMWVIICICTYLCVADMWLLSLCRRKSDQEFTTCWRLQIYKRVLTQGCVTKDKA